MANISELGVLLKANTSQAEGQLKSFSDKAGSSFNKLNVGLETSVIGKSELLKQCSAAIRAKYLSVDFHIGESFKISEIYSILNRVEGVIDVMQVKIVKKVGNAYSDIRFNINKNMTPDRRYVSCPQNVVFEVKYPRNDIKGTII